MIVPDFWAEARTQHRTADRRITVRRFGWSAVSADDAQAMAERRANEALSRLLAGDTLPRREPRVPYNGADGVPIREEVLERKGEIVITRNAYGARCLNSPDTLFADIDFDTPSGMRPVLATFGVLALVSFLLALAGHSIGLGLALVFASLILCVPLASLSGKALTAARGGAERRAHRRLAAFLATRTDWNVRVYRTPAGLRLLVTHRTFDPGESEVAEFFRAVGADPVYVRMCLHQRCFRARLTAKPWRIGMAGHLRPRPGVWPVAAEHMERRKAWIAQYEAKARAFAACRYTGSSGSGTVVPDIQSVIDLHDKASRAGSDAPLA